MAALLSRGGETIQAELRAHLRSLCRPQVDPGAIVSTRPGPLPVKAILHAVAIDAFYDSSIDLVRQTIESVFRESEQLGASTIVMPALATGYGPLNLDQFAMALAQAIASRCWSFTRLTVVVRHEDDAATIRNALNSHRVH